MSAKIWQRSIALALAASLMASPAMAGGHKHKHGRGCGHGRHGRSHDGDRYDRYDDGRWVPARYWAPPQHHHHKSKNDGVDAGDIVLATAVGLGVVALWGLAQQQADANAQAQVLQAPVGHPSGDWREPQ